MNELTNVYTKTLTESNISKEIQGDIELILSRYEEMLYYFDSYYPEELDKFEVYFKKQLQGNQRKRGKTIK